MEEIADVTCKAVDTIKSCKEGLFKRLGAERSQEALAQAMTLNCYDTDSLYLKNEERSLLDMRNFILAEADASVQKSLGKVCLYERIPLHL